MASMRSFVITRLVLFPIMLWFLLTVVFLLVRVLPGANPVRVINPQLPADEVERISRELGLNKPIPEQYINFLLDTLRMDFGTSYRTKIPVIRELQLAYGPTVMLGVGGALIGVPLGIFLGSYSGSKREKVQDHAVRLYTVGIYAIPIFLLGILMQFIFSYILHLLPPLGLMKPGYTEKFTHYTEIWIIDIILSGKFNLLIDLLAHLIMPCLALGMLIASVIARQVRIHMINQLEQDYVQFSRARGISNNRVVYRYALKNAVAPTIGLIGLQFALLLAGAILTETTFNIPGLGRYLFNAITNKDFPAVQGSMVIFAFVVSFVSLISDLLYAIIDPRIRY